MRGLCLLTMNALQSSSDLAPWLMRRKRYAEHSGKTSDPRFANGEKLTACLKIRCRRFAPVAISNELPRREKRRILALPAPTPDASNQRKTCDANVASAKQLRPTKNELVHALAYITKVSLVTLFQLHNRAA